MVASLLSLDGIGIEEGSGGKQADEKDGDSHSRNDGSALFLGRLNFHQTLTQIVFGAIGFAFRDAVKVTTGCQILVQIAVDTSVNALTRQWSIVFVRGNDFKVTRLGRTSLDQKPLCRGFSLRGPFQFDGIIIENVEAQASSRQFLRLRIDEQSALNILFLLLSLETSGGLVFDGLSDALFFFLGDFHPGRVLDAIGVAQVANLFGDGHFFFHQTFHFFFKRFFGRHEQSAAMVLMIQMCHTLLVVLLGDKGRRHRGAAR
mmetsp:Transcript_28322/g.77757  ORF Transcript_28322/g.77757 Transcript_28322/m.77757 type:complete len:260 (+) Transcript_28322:152-931(+)